MEDFKAVKFSESARKVISRAQEEARRFNHNYISSEHILLALAGETESVAARVLLNLELDLHKIRSTVEFIIGRGEHPLPGEFDLTPTAKRIIELAIDESRRLNHHYVGTEHLLIGIMREAEGVASGVLESMGMTLEKIRTETVRVLNASKAEQVKVTKTEVTSPIDGLVLLERMLDGIIQGGVPKEHKKKVADLLRETADVLDPLER